MLEDVAAEFQLSTKEAIDRIQRLEEQGKLNGVTDDRGKYIFITKQEYEAVARYIKTKGRVTKAELLAECNKLVRMGPKAEDKERIKNEQKMLLQKVEKEFTED
jgi:hypothetical protein